MNKCMVLIYYSKAWADLGVGWGGRGSGPTSLENHQWLHVYWYVPSRRRLLKDGPLRKALIILLKKTL